jgi:phosphosulfolactate synthase
VSPIPPSTSPFDPGYDPATVESHLEQSSHLMSSLKISMACWLVANEAATRRKIAAAHKYGVQIVTGGGPFEIAVAQGELPAYLELCANTGVGRIECGEGFTDLRIEAKDVVRMANEREGWRSSSSWERSMGGVHQRRGGRVDRAGAEMARCRSN